MKKLTLFLSAMLLACATTLWAEGENTSLETLFHETFGNNENKARVWDDKYSVKSGVAAVYQNVVYSTTNVKQGKNNTGKVDSGLNQSSANTDAIFIAGPLSVAGYQNLGVTYYWKAASISGTYTTNLYYSTDGTNYTEVTRTSGKGATSFVQCVYSLPEAAQSNNLYLKVVFNTSNTQAIIDEFVLMGESASTATLQSIEITGEPTKKDYMAGEAFSTDGLKVMGNYDDDTKKEITEGIKWTVTPATLTAGTKSVEVKATVGGITTTRTIEGLTVTAPKTLTSIAVSGTPDKTNYEKGETFDPTGLVVTGTYSDGSTQAITEGITWTITPEVLETTTTEVKVVATVGTINSPEYSVPVTVTEHVITPGTYTIALNAGLYGVSTGNNGTEQTVTKNDITITSGCTSSATSKTYYDAGHIRYYTDSYLKLAVPTGYDITKIEFTAFDSNWKGSITASVGTYDNKTKTWTGGANSVDFSFGAQNRIASIAVTYKKVLVAAPVLTAEDGKVAGGKFFEAFQLTMTCATKDATIFYTLDESDPKTNGTTYTAAITIRETTTVRAIAKAGEEWSREATETYTKLVALTTMDEIFTTATEAGKSTVTKYVTFNNWVVTGVKGSNAYLTDGTKGLIIYTSSHGFKAGDMLSGTVSCDITLFNGNAEIKGLNAKTTGLTVTEGGTAPVQTPSIAELSPINTGSLISLSNLTYNDAVLADAEGNKITPYNSFITLPTMTNGKKYNVKGVYIDFNGTKEIAPLATSDIQEVTTPSAIESAAVETPAVKTIENGQLIILRDGVKYNAMGVRLQ